MTNIFRQDLMEKTISLKLIDKKIDNKGNLVPFSWEEMAYELAKINPVWIKELGADALDENIRKEIINQNPGAIRFFKNPTDEEKIMAIKQVPDLISYIKKPTEEVMRAALFSDKVGTEDPAKQTSPEVMWKQVTGKLSKLPNGLAAAVSEDPRYMRLAYDDFGIYRKENGEIKSSSKYNVFGKAYRNFKKLPNTVHSNPALVDYLSKNPDMLKKVEDAMRNKMDMSRMGDLAQFSGMSSLEIQKARKMYNDSVARDANFDATKKRKSSVKKPVDSGEQNLTPDNNTKNKKESALDIFQKTLSESTKRFLERE